MAGSTAHRFIGEMQRLDLETVRGEGRERRVSNTCGSNAEDEEVRRREGVLINAMHGGGNNRKWGVLICSKDRHINHTASSMLLSPCLHFIRDEEESEILQEKVSAPK